MGGLGPRGRLVAVLTLVVAGASVLPWWGRPVMDPAGSVTVEPWSSPR